MAFEHVPVMAGEVVELLLPVPAGVLIDATVGGGGHARLALEARPDLELLGIDRDPAAVAAARERLAGPVHPARTRQALIPKTINEYGRRIRTSP